MKFAIVFVLLAAILLAVTNPSEDQHHAAIRDEVAKRGLVGALVGGVGALMLEYHSFVLGSYTLRRSEVASVGALGLVWVDGDAVRP